MPFLTPYPTRHPAPIPMRQRMRLAKRNFLEVWEAEDFESSFFTFRFLSKQVAVCNSPETVRHALVTNAANYHRKSPETRHALRPLIGDGLFISDGALWQSRRRAIAPVIHGARMAEFAPVMIEAAAETRDRWAGLSDGAPIDVLDEMARLSAEIICRTVFGRALGREHAREIVEAFSAYQRQIGPIDMLSILSLPDWLPRPRGRVVRESVARIDAVMAEIIARCREDARGTEGNLLRDLMHVRDPETGAPLDDAALRDEAMVIFMAGHETTANTLAWCWYLLSQAATKERALHAELDRVLGGRTPTQGDVANLVYTRAVVEETLRLYPPVPFLAREAAGPDAIEGQPIRRGTILLAVPWLLHRRAEYWKHPDHFIPERFLPDAKRKPVRYAYIPFGVGPRVCAGMTFGMTETVLALATLAQRFRLTLKPGTRIMPICRLTLRPGEDGLRMTLARRAEERPGGV